MKGRKSWLVAHAALVPVVLLLVAIVLEALGLIPEGVARAIARLLVELLAELPDGLPLAGRPFGSSWFSPAQILLLGRS